MISYFTHRQLRGNAAPKLWRVFLAAALLCFYCMAMLAQAQTPTEGPIIEWEKRQNANDRLRAYGDDILGDGIDPHTGTIVFNHRDIVLPGNSGLEVALRRRRSQGMLYHDDVDAEFGDWEYQVPRISAVSATVRPWVGARCTTPFANKFTTIILGTSQTLGSDYSNGVTLNVAGQGSQQVLEKLSSGVQWPSAATHVTTGNWYLTCGNASDGGEGFIGTAPNGDIYRFDKVITHQAKALGYIGGSTSPISRNMYILAATQVTDVNGNWVKYDYDSSGRLTKIHGSDLRAITLTYSGSSKLVSSASANGRTWTYTYRTTDFERPDWDPDITDVPDAQVLDRVTQPDSKYWSFDLDNMRAQPRPGNNCVKLQIDIALTHPYGTVGTFKLKDTDHRHVFQDLLRGKDCPNAEPPPPGGPGPTPFYYTVVTPTMAVIEKKFTGPSLNQALWTYTYESDLGPGGSSSSDKTNWTKVLTPTSHITYTHNWVTEPLGGKLMKKEIRANSTSAVLQTETYTYEKISASGNTFAATSHNSGSLLTSVKALQTVVLRDGDTFTTLNTYDAVSASPTYSYGFPTIVEVSSNVSQPPRSRVTTYAHNQTKWILGLPATVTTNARNMASYAYDSLGRKISQTRYGSPHATFSYNSDGTIAWFKDALGRQTSALNWKRGTPQEIKRADTTTEAISTYQYVDDNGWLTSSIDGRGYTTSYTRDTMGRLTTATPPAGWDPTSINYSFGNNIIQTITKGDGREIITYDNLFRPTLVQSTDLGNGNSGNNSSYVKNTYDGSGQTVFTSFPEFSSNPVSGTDFVYDGLGRILTATENVAPFFAKTTHQYYSSHRRRVLDPSNKYTDYYGADYDGPGSSVYRAIYQVSAGTYTYLTRNVHGQLLRTHQWGSLNGYIVDQNKYYYYNTAQQICRYREKEGGDTVYEYNLAGELTSFQKGLGNGSTCTAPSGNDKISLSYDELGRPVLTDFTNAATPDIATSYDDNSNILSLNRGSGSGAVNRSYVYDTLNNLTSESLTLDGRSYALGYGYSASGYLTSRSLPSGRSIAYTVDGLGRAQSVTHNGANVATGMDYHANDAVSGLSYGNGQVFSQTLTARQEPLRLHSVLGGNTALDLTYDYNKRGLIKSIVNGQDSSDNRVYGYDGGGRIKSSTGPWGSGTYYYDSLGNIRRKTEGSRALIMNYDTNNRLSSHTDTVGGSRWLSYDGRGNTTGLSAQHFIYDVSDQPVALWGTVSGSYKYDGNNKRAKAVMAGKAIYNVYDASGTLVHVDEDTDGKKTDYIKGGRQTLARVSTVSGVDTITYLHPDVLGSAQTGTTSTGSIAWREAFHPYGEATTNHASGDNQAGFTGHIKDKATGLSYMQARYYDPLIGRFLSIDPVTFDGTNNPGYFNRYAYTFNDPINNIDPDGQQVFPRDDGRTVIVYPQKTTTHVDKRHSPTGTAQNKFTQTLGKEKGQVMAMRTIEKSVSDGTFVREGNDTVYEGKIGGIFTDVGSQGEDTNRVVTQDLETMSDPEMLSQVAAELSTPEAVGTLAALEAAAPANADPIKVEVIKTQHPVFEEDRKTGK